jgi:hypothetical protein
MSIRLICPAGHPITASDEAAGEKIQCPDCGHWTFVPDLPERRDDQDVGLDGPGGSKTKLSTTAGRSGQPRSPKTPAPPPLPAREELSTAPGPAALPGDNPLSESGNDAVRTHEGWTQPRLVPLHAERPDRGRLQTLRLIAVYLGIVAALNLAPVVLHAHLDPEPAPGWARAALVLAAIQAVYVCWLLATPDWSTLWVVMVVFALSAAVYGMAIGITLASPPDKPLPFGLGQHRRTAPRWCGSVLLLTALATYLCGRASTRWRRSSQLRRAGHGRAERSY